MRWDPVVAAGAGDFFDEVDACGDVRAPRGHGHGQTVLADDFDARTDAFEQTGHLGGCVVGRPTRESTRLTGSSMTVGSGACPTCVVAGLSVPPASSTSRSAQRRAATGPSFESTPRSKRREASEDSLCRREVPGDRDRVEVSGLDDHVGGLQR